MKEMNKLQYMWYDRKYLVRRQREKFIVWVAHHLPRELVMRCFFRVVAHGTTGKFGNTVVPEVRAMTIANRWDQPNN